MPPIRLLTARLVLWCWDHGPLVCLLALAVSLPCLFVAFTRLSLDTDETHMIAEDLPYRQAERRFDAAFPDTRNRLVAVVEAATPELAEQAAQALLARLRGRADLFRAVERPPEEVFFRRNGLLFLPPSQVEEVAEQLIRAQPLLGGLAADPSLRGVMNVLNLMLEGARRGDIVLAEAVPAIIALSKAGEAVLAGRPAALSWQFLLTGEEHGDKPHRRFVLVTPRLDYSRLVPGEAATRGVRAATAGLDAHIRLTGMVALMDDNFRTVAEGTGLSAGLALAAVTVLLLLGVGSLRLTAAILLTLLTGLSVTSAFAALVVGTLNPISVAFVALFIGLAVDFAIQFTIRYRDDHFHEADAGRAMRRSAHAIPFPLLVVAAAIAAGFFSFLPTAYVGVSQLGLIAGVGMAIGVAATLTVLPALLAVVRPKPELAPPGFNALEPLESAMRRNGGAVLVVTVLAALVCTPLATLLDADFDPLHMQDPAVESVATFRALAAEPETTPYAVNVLASSEASADALAARLSALPEIAHAVRLADFVPGQQDRKLPVIDDARQLLAPSLYPAQPLPAPNSGQNRAAVERAAAALLASGDGNAERLAHILRVLLERGRIDAFERALAASLPQFLEDLRQALEVSEIRAETLPPALVRDWVGTYGQRRIEVRPAMVTTDPVALTAFVDAVRRVAPEAAGLPVAIVESGRVVLLSFAQAGIFAMTVIAILLAVILRRPLDVLLVIVPLALGGVFTVAAMVVLRLPVNFANIIAFPLVLGVGVAYNVYAVMNWRAGMKALLPSAVARAIVFSALTTGVAFGALSLSPHRGTASLGLVLLLALLLMVAASFLILPASFALLDRRRKAPP